MPTRIQKIETTKAPKAIGPYSQAISIPANERLIFVSGQLPIDPTTGELVQGNIATLTHLVIDNLEAILITAGSSLNEVIRTDVFLTDLKTDFGSMNAEYAKRFTSQTPPARQTIEVSSLPKGAIIEISCIAIARGTSK